MSGGLNDCGLSVLHGHKDLQNTIMRTSDANEMFISSYVKISFYLMISVEQ